MLQFWDKLLYVFINTHNRTDVIQYINSALVLGPLD